MSDSPPADAEDGAPVRWRALAARAGEGDSAASGELFAALYDELHRIARRESRRSSGLLSLSTTTLLHEAYLDVSRRDAAAFADKSHFLAYAARAMRGLVIDRLRARQAVKRGGGLHLTDLDTEVAESCAEPALALGVAEALEELAGHDSALALVVDLKFFCGFSVAEIAAMHQTSERTVQRQWEKARLFLHRALSEA